MIRPVQASDAQAIADIYNEYILNSVITFEEQAITAQDMAVRFEEVSSSSLPWCVAESDGRVLGYAYASKWKGRCAYRFSVETTVYVDASSKGKGIGSMLYEALLAQLRAQKYHLAIGGIALPNAASIKLHEKFGFEKVAHFKEVGFKFGHWVDVGYWQVVLPNQALNDGAQNARA
jgi:phosphinothricin acetyltransferase